MKLEDWYRLTERTEERALRRRLRREAALDAVGTVLLALAMGVICWLWAAAGPTAYDEVDDLVAPAGEWGAQE